MTTTLVLPQSIAEETAGVLLASLVDDGKLGLRLLARQVRWVENPEYYRREHSRLSIGSGGYVNALAAAETLGATAIWVHTHPGLDSRPLASVYDRRVDLEIADLFRLRSGSAYYGALVLSPHPQGFTFTGHLEPEDGGAICFDRIWIVGGGLRLLRSFDTELPELSPIFDRNVRAFGGGVQQALANIHVGIVGCGGTGSAVAEQLVRLGVRRFTLVDPDHLSASNVTRVYGSTPCDIDRPKVDVLAEHLLRIAPEAVCESIRSSVASEAAARRLTSSDVIFGCTDDNAGRLVLSRAATYLLTPVIDSGVLLSSGDGGELVGIDGRVTVLVPGQPCLLCRGRVDVSRAAAEALSPEERTRRQHEGYAPALGAVEPAVVSFTTLVAATAVSELLERLIGYGPEPRPSEILLRCHEREISTNVGVPGEGHYCHSASGKLGIGITDPFLEKAWPN